MEQRPAPIEYQKPEAPGIAINFDNTVSLYHVVSPDDSFERAALDLFDLLIDAQTRFPDWPRAYYVDIVGHVNPDGRFEEDFVELQQEFFFSTIAPFVTALELPLTGPLLNPEPQRNDVPDGLNISDDDAPGA